MRPEDTLPALRPIDISPLPPQDGELFFALHDMSRVSPRTIAVSFAAYFVLAHFDGRTTLGELQGAFRQRFGADVSIEEVRSLAETLDQLLFLHGDRYERAYAERVAAYRAAPFRDNRSRWPEGEALRAEIEQVLALAPSAPLEACAGLIAPHLDYQRGGPCYATAYAAVRALPAFDRYVILGTNHFGRARCVVATGKDVLTPLGPVRTDLPMIEELERRLGQSLRTHEYDHLAEHSVELQVHVLQAILGDHPFEIVPLLCPDPSGPTGTRPADGRGPDLGDFADALGALILEDRKRTLLIASADLSHVGMHFGEPAPTTREYLEKVGEWDQMLLGLLASGRAEEFVRRVADARNPTRICSVGCVYALARALRGGEVRILRYHQARNEELDMHVTCCAGVVAHAE